MSDSDLGSDLDSSSKNLPRAPSFADFLEGFKSARMSFEPLEDWLFVRASEDHNKRAVSGETNSKSPSAETENHTNIGDDFDTSDGIESSIEDETDENSGEDDVIMCHFDSSADDCSDDEADTDLEQKSNSLSVNAQSADTADQNSILGNNSEYSPFCSDRYVTSRKRCLANNDCLPVADKCENSVETQGQLVNVSHILDSADDVVSGSDGICTMGPESYYLVDDCSACEPLSYIRKPLSPSYLNCKHQKDVENLPKAAVKRRKSEVNFYKVESQNNQLEELDANSKDQKTEEDKVTKQAHKRKRIIQEILETEATYHRHLELIVKHFEDPLHETGMIDNHVITSIFGNIRQIIGVNEELMKRLQTMNIGEAFLQLGPFLKLYSSYANNHERALAALMDCEQKHPCFSQFRRQQEELAEMNGLKLNALLITPVQRIPRYKLLLSELLVNTPSDDADYHALTEAVTQISDVASHINDHIKQQDNFMRMLAIQRSLACPVGPRILVPGRIFIKEGQLKKVSKRASFCRSNERTFFLFSDVLMYAKPRLLEGAGGGSVRAWGGGGGRTPASSPSLVCCCILPLHHCRVERVLGRTHGSDEQGALFTVTCKDESLLLYSDHKTVNSWIESLTKAISDCKLNRQTLRKTSSAKKPLRRSGITRLWKAEKEADPLLAAVGSPDKLWAKSNGKCGNDSSTAESPGGSILSRLMSPASKSSPSGSTGSRKRHFGLNFACLSSRGRRREKKLGKMFSSPHRVAPSTDVL